MALFSFSRTVSHYGLIALATATITFPILPTHAATVTAQPAQNFVNGLGVMTHLDNKNSGYADLKNVETDLFYIGTPIVRDTMTAEDSAARFAQLNKDIGVKFDLIFGADTSGFQWQLQQLAGNPAVVAFVEGPNESDNWPVTYNDMTGINATMGQQDILYSYIKATPALKAIPVLQASFGKQTSFAEVTALASYSDFGNAHIYFANGNPPNSGPIAARMKDAQSIAPGKSIFATETGYSTAAGDVNSVSPAVQAKYILTLLMENWHAGIQHSNIFELADEEPADTFTHQDYHFGLFNFDMTPKPAATALHNLVGLMTDTTSGKKVSNTLGYTLSGAPDTLGSNLFQRRDDIFILVLWNDVRLSGPATQQDIDQSSVNILLHLDKQAKAIQIYDPLTGMQPVKSDTTVQGMLVKVPDHPVLIFIKPR